MRMRASAVVLAGLVLSSMPGCGVNRRYANDTIQQLNFRDVRIDYKLSSEVIPASADHSAAPVHLAIVYPHPSPSLGSKYARAMLIERAAPAGRFQAIQAAFSDKVSDGEPLIEQAITRQELEFLLEDLVADGFFDRGTRTGGVALNVRIGSRAANKSWDRVSALDQLAGQLKRKIGLRSSPPSLIPRLLPADEIEQAAGTDWEEGEPVQDAGSPDVPKYF